MIHTAAEVLPQRRSGLQGFVADTIVITRRNLLTLTRTPQVIVFASIQPVIFVLSSATSSEARSTSPDTRPTPTS